MTKTNGAVLAVAFASCAAATALGADNGGSVTSKTARATRMHLIEIQRGTTQLDLGRKGFSAGDRQTITSDVEDSRGRAAGRLDDDCAITAVGKRAGATCNFVITLSGGQLSGQFFQSFGPGGDSSKLQVITGGTGRYGGARGQIRVGREGRRTPFVIELR